MKNFSFSISCVGLSYICTYTISSPFIFLILLWYIIIWCILLLILLCHKRLNFSSIFHLHFDPPFSIGFYIWDCIAIIYIYSLNTFPPYRVLRWDWRGCWLLRQNLYASVFQIFVPWGCMYVLWSNIFRIIAFSSLTYINITSLAFTNE